SWFSTLLLHDALPIWAPMGNLQFDHVERDGSPSRLTCAACNQAIASSYYEVNGSVTCLRCRNQIMAGWNRGSAGGRFAKALGLRSEEHTSELQSPDHL